MSHLASLASFIEAHAVLWLYMSKLCHLGIAGDTRDKQNQGVYWEIEFRVENGSSLFGDLMDKA